MAQIFHPSTNTISKVTIFESVFYRGLVWVLLFTNRSSYVMQVGVNRE